MECSWFKCARLLNSETSRSLKSGLLLTYYYCCPQIPSSLLLAISYKHHITSAYNFTSYPQNHFMNLLL